MSDDEKDIKTTRQSLRQLSRQKVQKAANSSKTSTMKEKAAEQTPKRRMSKELDKAAASMETKRKKGVEKSLKELMEAEEEDGGKNTSAENLLKDLEDNEEEEETAVTMEESSKPRRKRGRPAAKEEESEEETKAKRGKSEEKTKSKRKGEETTKLADKKVEKKDKDASKEKEGSKDEMSKEKEVAKDETAKEKEMSKEKGMKVKSDDKTKVNKSEGEEEGVEGEEEEEETKLEQSRKRGRPKVANEVQGKSDEKAVAAAKVVTNKEDEKVEGTGSGSGYMQTRRKRLKFNLDGSLMTPMEIEKQEKRDSKEGKQDGFSTEDISSDSDDGLDSDDNYVEPISARKMAANKSNKKWDKDTDEEDGKKSPISMVSKDGAAATARHRKGTAKREVDILKLISTNVTSAYGCPEAITMSELRVERFRKVKSQPKKVATTATTNMKTSPVKAPFISKHVTITPVAGKPASSSTPLAKMVTPKANAKANASAITAKSVATASSVAGKKINQSAMTTPAARQNPVPIAPKVDHTRFNGLSPISRQSMTGFNPYPVDSRIVRTKYGPKKELAKRQASMGMPPGMGGNLIIAGAKPHTSSKLEDVGGVRSIYDVMLDVSEKLPSWNLHVFPDNAYCIAQISRGRTGTPVLKKSIEVSEQFQAKVYVHQLHCKRFDGKYDSEKKLVALINEVNLLSA